MGSLKPESDPKHELDDSGYVQEETTPALKQASCENGYEGVQLLDLSDDVLLYILKHCSPWDLKAVGYTCPRLGALVLDRTLWQRVDARQQPSGRIRLRWFLTHALSSATTELKLSGYAKEAIDCLGYVKQIPNEENVAKQPQTSNENNKNTAESTPSASTSSGANETSTSTAREPVLVNNDLNNLLPSPQRIRVSRQQLPRFSSFPSWPDDYVSERPAEGEPPSACAGPRLSLCRALLARLRARCPNLTSLSLEYCIIDTKTTGITQFPVTLKKLSLRGTKCYNLDKPFLFKIQDCLVHLEELDVSECSWLEPEAMLPLSKMPALARLLMRRCCRLTEFVAYASLATRYGFRNLKVVDLRESPVGDSEVSAFGWLPLLEELRLSPAGGMGEGEGVEACPGVERRSKHVHYCGDGLPDHQELDPWEMQEPEYFTSKYQSSDASEADFNMEDEVSDDASGEEYPQRRENSCAHGNTGCIIMGPSGHTHVTPNSENGVHSNQARQNVILPQLVDGDMQFPYYMFPNRNLPNSYASVPCPSNSVTLKRRPLENGSGDSADLYQGPSTKRKKDETPCSCNRAADTKMSSKNTTLKADNSDDDDDSSGQAKRSRRNEVNEGASTSKITEPSEDSNEKPSTSTCQNPEPKSKECECRPKYEKFVHFRQNQNPVIVERPVRSEDRTQMPDTKPVNREPKHKILYVNVSQRLHTSYQLSMPLCTVREPVDLRTYNLSRSRRQLLCPPPYFTHHGFMPPRLDPSSLVTDSAIRRFGRADGENINYVNIGPDGPVRVQFQDSGSRPDRSNLRILSMPGFTHITNTSLVHLATAAPHLRVLDVSGTGVTRQGVDKFRTLRPDCEVIFGELPKND